MNTRPQMMIFHEPDVLEFAADGKSLGRFRDENAEYWFQYIKRSSDAVAFSTILSVFNTVRNVAVRAESPAAADAGFERRVPE